MDELFESLTLIQTRKIKHFPVVLFGSEYWGGLLDWLKNTMEAEGNIAPGDLELFKVTDSPQEAVEHVVKRYNHHSEIDGNGLHGVVPLRPGEGGGCR
jgi:predicted Rossmann-fold nucleotide-binding protein